MTLIHILIEVYVSLSCTLGVNMEAERAAAAEKLRQEDEKRKAEFASKVPSTFGSIEVRLYRQKTPTTYQVGVPVRDPIGGQLLTRCDFFFLFLILLGRREEGNGRESYHR